MALQTVGGPVSKTGMSRLTTEHIYFPIKTQDNLTSVTASLAFLINADAKPVPQDWVPASIEPTPGDPEVSSIRILIGPELGGHALTPVSESGETYHCWAKLETGNEVIVRRAGTLFVR